MIPHTVLQENTITAHQFELTTVEELTQCDSCINIINKIALAYDFSFFHYCSIL